MSEEDKYCPYCGSEKIFQTDYENEEGVEDTEGRGCEDCHWEGDVSELVYKP